MKYPIISKALSRSILTGVVVAVVFATSAAAEDESIPCIPEGAAPMSVSYGDVLSDGGSNCVITPASDIDVFQFTGNVADIVRLTVTDVGGDLVNSARVDLFDPNGVLVNSFFTSTSNGQQGAHLDVTLPMTGLYTILLSESGSNQTLAYNLGLKLLSPPAGVPATYGQNLSYSIRPPADVDQFVFTGTAGDMMRIAVTDVGGDLINSARVELFDPNGVLVDSFVTSTSNGTQGAQLDAPLTTTGLYSLVVTENGTNQTLDYNLTLQCLFGACATAPPTCLIDLSLDGTTMNIDLLLATPEPAQYQMYLYGNVGNILLLNAAIPAVPNATALPLSIAGFPDLGTIAMWSSIRTASGVRCFSFDAIDSSAVASAVSSGFSSRRSNSPKADTEELGDKLRKGLQTRSPNGTGNGLLK